MRNHYKTLGVTNAATPAEIRRAYRILARRYHPDVNPGRSSEEVFKSIAEAYSVLSEPDKRQQHDLELERAAESFAQTFDRAHEVFRRNQQTQAYKKSQEQKPPGKNQQRPEPEQTSPRASAQHQAHHQTTKQTTQAEPKRAQRPLTPRKAKASIRGLVTNASNRLRASSRRLTDTSAKALKRLTRTARATKLGTTVSNISLVEASVSIHDAIQGAKRTIEISEPNREPRKVSVAIPPGVRSGSIIRLRRKEDASEEIVVVVQVEHHPWLSISERGLTMEIPLTVSEAITGGKIQIPSLGEPLLLTVEPGTQSGREVRLKQQGIVHRDGSRGNLFIRFIVKVPDTNTTGATSTEESSQLPASAKTLDAFYASSVRCHLPRSLIEV